MENKFKCVLSESSFVEKQIMKLVFVLHVTQNLYCPVRSVHQSFLLLSSTPRSPSHARKIPENEYRRNTGRDPPSYIISILKTGLLLTRSKKDI